MWFRILFEQNHKGRQLIGFANLIPPKLPTSTLPGHLGPRRRSDGISGPLPLVAGLELSDGSQTIGCEVENESSVF
jgi:hypothetical protein